MQRQDFARSSRSCSGLPVTIRLLDPPLHEFLPHGEAEMAEVAAAAGARSSRCARGLIKLAEANPMLGHRGCRLGITYPEIYEMQARAIFEAAAQVDEGRRGETVEPEIMIPLIAIAKELDLLKALDRPDRRGGHGGRRRQHSYMVGTMIELPRAACRGPRSPGRRSSSASAPTT